MNEYFYSFQKDGVEGQLFVLKLHLSSFFFMRTFGVSTYNLYRYDILRVSELNVFLNESKKFPSKMNSQS